MSTATRLALQNRLLANRPCLCYPVSDSKVSTLSSVPSCGWRRPTHQLHALSIRFLIRHELKI